MADLPRWNSLAALGAEVRDPRLLLLLQACLPEQEGRAIEPSKVAPTTLARASWSRPKHTGKLTGVVGRQQEIPLQLVLGDSFKVPYALLAEAIGKPVIVPLVAWEDMLLDQ